MGFCRRCGDIVAGARCQCGGTPVDPVVPWSQANAATITKDRWSNTYVARARSVSPTRKLVIQTASPINFVAQTPPAKRFPQPILHGTTPPALSLGSQVTAHISSSLFHPNRPPSPLKYSSPVPAPEAGILPSLNNSTLSKAYGSVLQPKESLVTHSCAICSSPFPPDATIYPDPSAASALRFLCRPCFESNGGSKGTCPACLRPVLALKREGGFIHAGFQYWHKSCFNCSGCLKHIGDTPMVDLLGRPSCAECFESCLKRDPATPKKHKLMSADNNASLGKTSNIGGMNSKSTAWRSKESSPAMEELQLRLGITSSEGNLDLENLQWAPESSPPRHSVHSTVGDLPASERRQYCCPKDTNSTKVASQLPHSLTLSNTPSPSPLKSQSNGSPVIGTIQEMKQKLIKSSQSPNPGMAAAALLARTSELLRLQHPLTSSPPLGSFGSDYGLTPNDGPTMTESLTTVKSDFTTATSLDLRLPSINDGVLPRLSGAPRTDSLSTWKGNLFDASGDTIVEEIANELRTPSLTLDSNRVLSPPSTKILVPSDSPTMQKSSIIGSPLIPHLDSSTTHCVRCKKGLLSIRGEGDFVTVPDERSHTTRTYHVDCFRCIVCDGTFKVAATGKAVFVKANNGPCHVECRPPIKIVSQTLELQPPNTNPASFTSMSTLPNQPNVRSEAQIARVSSGQLERLPVNAPSTSFPRFGGRTVCPGCNKAVSPMEQGVVPGPQGTRWHACCLVCGGRKEPLNVWRGREERNKSEPGCGKRLDSAAKTGTEGGVWCRECLLLLGVGGTPLSPPIRAPMVSSLIYSKVASQLTGTTTLVRQFTGLGAGGDAGLLRQLTGGGLSPTRSISPTKQLGGGGTRPRPKSIIGIRNAKSVDEGRGMFLVKQLTGVS